MCRKLDNGNNLCMVSCGSEIREIDSSAKKCPCHQESARRQHGQAPRGDPLAQI
jgi:hypothetical protein